MVPAVLLTKGVARSYVPSMTRFVPAAFDLYEFDDSRLREPSGQTAERWFSGFNGAVGEPAQNVTLAWSDGASTALVCTSEHPPWDSADARSSAAHVALGGTALLPGRQSISPAETNAEIRRIATADRLWVRTSGIIPEEEGAHIAIWDRFALGYLQVHGSAVFLAAVNLDPSEFKIRKIEDWDKYDVDGSADFPISALRPGFGAY